MEIGNNKYPINFIRFGIQSKKQFLKDIQDLFDGIVIPANILLYQYKATPLIVYLCKSKYFFIDPMSYLFGQPYNDFIKKIANGVEFKPSFEKLLNGHGLSTMDLIDKDYNFLLSQLDTDKNRLHDFIKNCLDFQQNTVRDNLKLYASELVDEGTNFEDTPYTPSFLIPPYFLYERDIITTKLNIAILQQVESMKYGTEIYPMIFIKKDSLNDGFFESIIDGIEKDHNFKGYIIWINDFRESKIDNNFNMVPLLKIIKRLGDNGKKVIMMYGGYFSMLLYHLGLTGICHGTLHSESRNIKDSTKKTSGPAPIRYYINMLHEFFTLDNALEILKEEPSLLCNCPVCRRIVGSNPENIINYQNQEYSAEIHFLMNRKKEKAEIGRSTPKEIFDKLDFERITSQHINHVNTRYMELWSKNLKNISDNSI